MGRPPTWDDDQLREAVAASRSLKEVVERLRATAGGASHRAVAVRVEVLGLPTDHFGPAGAGSSEEGPRPRSIRRRWSDEALAEAVAASTSLKGVFDRLGLIPGGSQWQLVRALILELGLDTGHWPSPLETGRPREAVSDEQLRVIVPTARSVAEVSRRLGLPENGRGHARIRDRILALGLDTSHMTGRGWARGRTNPSGRTKRPLERLLVNGSAVPSARLRRRLIEEGIFLPRCSRCGGQEWCGGPMPLELDHINGDRRDNRLENLRLLCPNCHALTPTYRGRNIGRYDGEPLG